MHDKSPGAFASGILCPECDKVTDAVGGCDCGESSVWGDALCCDCCDELELPHQTHEGR